MERPANSIDPIAEALGEICSLVSIKELQKLLHSGQGDGGKAEFGVVVVEPVAETFRKTLRYGEYPVARTTTRVSATMKARVKLAGSDF